MGLLLPGTAADRSTTSSSRWRPYSLPKRRRIPLLCTSILALWLIFHLYYISTFPAQLIPRAEYLPVLDSALPFFPAHMRGDLRGSLHRLHRSMIRSSSSSSSLYRSSSIHEQVGNISLIANRVWQTDRTSGGDADAADDASTWTQMGFERVFLDDGDALKWVAETFGDSEITRTYRALPKPVMKADMLRYLLLLARGGVYSDIDTRALMPLSRWASGVEVFRFSRSSHPPSARHDSPLPSSRHEGRGPVDEDVDERGDGMGREMVDGREMVEPEPEPIRFVLGVEGDFHIWRDKTMMSEGIGLTKSGRHRSLQFTQWTLASSPSHPILIDVIRRIIDTRTLARAWEISQIRSAQALEAMGWGERAERERGRERPWDRDTKGGGFGEGGGTLGLGGGTAAMGVQEWTGPAVFTDAALSYLLAVAGVREQDLYHLDRPVQIADVLVLPIDGFHPTRDSIRNNNVNPMARVAHMFRGSWKDPWPLGLDKIMDLAGAGGGKAS